MRLGVALARDPTTHRKLTIWSGKCTAPVRHIQVASVREPAAGPRVQMRTSVPNDRHSRVECVSQRSNSVSPMST